MSTARNSARPTMVRALIEVPASYPHHKRTQRTQSLYSEHGAQDRRGNGHRVRRGRVGAGPRPAAGRCRLARTANPSAARQDIALVEINEYSLRNLEPNAGRWPWPRAFHAQLLEYLA